MPADQLIHGDAQRLAAGQLHRLRLAHGDEQELPAAAHVQ